MGSKKPPLLLQCPDLPPAKLLNFVHHVQCGLCDQGPARSSEGSWSPAEGKGGDSLQFFQSSWKLRDGGHWACWDSGLLLNPDQDVSHARPGMNQTPAHISPQTQEAGNEAAASMKGTSGPGECSWPPVPQCSTSPAVTEQHPALRRGGSDLPEELQISSMKQRPAWGTAGSPGAMVTLQLWPEHQGNRILQDMLWHPGTPSLPPETSAPPAPQLL